ncbi:hypothetical protein [Romboutsia sp.]|uniref:hypothetical protein n=1 Tax=Romboutsia sp. TaxID=1965302 RepID=UPI002D02AAA1|nr:hypothetical protein [Romboutsia sp.]HSQ89320.1 hypothetical protein [Romboutsia sp.]
MKDNRFKKGQYEDAVELAKDLLMNNVGMSDIVAKTNLTQEEVRKIIRKRDAELNDKSTKLF